MLGASLVTHACRKGGSHQGLEGKAGHRETWPQASMLSALCLRLPVWGRGWVCPPPAGSKGPPHYSNTLGQQVPVLGATSMTPHTPNRQGPHASTEPAAETQDCLAQQRKPGQANPAPSIQLLYLQPEAAHVEVRQEPKAYSPSAGTVASPGTCPQQAAPAMNAVKSARRITEQKADEVARCCPVAHTRRDAPGPEKP